LLSQDEKEMSPTDYMFQQSKRMNVLLIGMEGPRTDTIMVASFDPKSKKIDIISVPRDTYYERNKHHSAGKKKINAVYYDDGIEGIQSAVSDILSGMPIEYYIKVKYDGVEKVVDSLGGVPVYVPMDMDYDDEYDSPPLHIHFPKGSRVLSGEEAIKFLRFRKNNDGTGYPDGDIGRIKTQQEFLKAAFKKTMGYRLPVVANTVMKYIKTDVPLGEVAKMATSAIGMSSEDIATHSVLGESIYLSGVSYYEADKEKTLEMIKSIYQSNETEAAKEVIGSSSSNVSNKN
ncbi:MAG: LCP family protein, partial [Clostridia bacterium]|nr:LCP family protein [Clostridia bacterium]